MRTKCKKCGAGPFKTSQALGAHNRYAHPKFKTVTLKDVPATKEEIGAGERLRQKIAAGFKAADNTLACERVQEENWLLRFLLRRGAKLNCTDDIMHAVRLEIIKLEKELREATTPDHGTPF